MSEMNDLSAKDIIRNQIQKKAFSDNQTKKTNINFSKIKPSLEQDIFDTLKKYGYERDKVINVVANLMSNLSCL